MINFRYIYFGWIFIIVMFLLIKPIDKTSWLLFVPSLLIGIIIINHGYKEGKEAEEAKTK